MRKLGKKNYLLFGLFAIIIITLIVMFVLGITKALKKQSTKYELNVDELVFDNNYNYFLSSSNSHVYLNWNNNYYYKAKKKTEKLGSVAFTFDKNNNILKTYGKLYKVNLDGRVNVLKDNNKIQTTNASFYKIDDRKYLFVDSSLKSSDGSVNTGNFLIIEVNKNGNASFYNDEINMNTIKPISLIGSKFVFDIANEKLIVNKLEIDLKNIIGSSNDYVPEKEEGIDAIDYLTETFNEYVKNNPGGDSTTNNNNNTIINGNTGDTEEDNKTQTVFTKWLNITSSSTSINSITINYIVFDPNNEYESVYLDVTDMSNDENYTINLSKDSTSYVIYNLKTNNQYRIELKYSIGGVSFISDSLLLRTLLPSYKITIDKIDKLNSKIYYTIIGNKNYVFTSGNLNVYSDNNSIYSVQLSSKEFDLASKSGYSSVIDYSTFTMNKNITIKVENLEYNSVITDYSFYTKLISR